MSSFDGRLRMPGRSRLPLGVEIDILHERMTLTAGERTVGNWPLDRLEVISLSDGFHIRVDDEEIVLTVSDSTKFATELGITQRAPTPTADTNRRPDLTRMADGAKISAERIDKATSDEEQIDEIQDRISEVAEALGSDSVSPAQAFARWLELLKEINRRHGQGSMPTHVFFQVNTQLLDLIAGPTPDLTAR